MKYFQDITLGQYVDRDSPLHRLDAKVKMGLLVVLMVYIMRGQAVSDYLILTVFFLGLIGLGRLPVKRVLKGLRPIVYLAIFTLILHVLLTPERDQTFLFFSYSSAGLREGLFVSFRLLLLILSATLLTLTTKPLELTLAMKKLLSPFQRFGLPAYELSMMMMISLRFIPVIGEETGRLVIAQQSRGGDFKSKNFSGKLLIINNTITALFFRIFARADSVAVAMESRGYPGVAEQADLYPSKIDMEDFTAVSLIIALGYLLYRV